MKFIVQFDVTSNQNWERGVPPTKVFAPDTTLEEMYKWVKSCLGGGQYGYHRTSEIRISLDDDGIC